MLQSSAPVPLQLPFAANAGAGYTRAIPVASQIAITPGAASFNDGFPPINFLDPVLGGGVPFSGQDVNGVLNAITNALQWEQMNGSAAYNAAVSTAITGYPNGTILRKTGAPGYWQSTVDNNVTNPDTGGAGWQGFNPIDGITTIALTNVNVTLTAAQYGNPMIVLTGTLSGAVSLILPAAIGRWIISNKCTGAFAVTAITSAGGSTGYVIPNAAVAHVFSDGTNIDLTSEVGSTRAPGTNDGTLATTAFVAAGLSGLGSIYAALAGLSTQAFSAANGTSGKQVVNISQYATSFAGTGYAKLPSGLIIQWSNALSLDQNALTTGTLAIAWPNTMLAAVAMKVGAFATSVTDSALLVRATPANPLTQIDVSIGSNGGGTSHALAVYYIAIGY